MTFRRFAVKEASGGEVEVMLNCQRISAIYEDDKGTRIELDNGTFYNSAVEYVHLASAMDRMKP